MTTDVCTQIRERIASYINVVKSRNEAIIKGLSAANNGKEPTVDVNGRYHAPYHGYVLDDSIPHYSGAVFGAGEYLPVPEDEGHDIIFPREVNYSKLVYMKRVKVKLQIIDELKSLLSEMKVEHVVSVTAGSSWSNGDELWAYAYIRSSVKTLITDIFNTLNLSSEVNKKDESEVKVELYLEGKIEVTAKVMSVKFAETIYGITQKMYCKTDEGHLISSTVPRAISDVQAGDTVSFSATFTKGTEGWSSAKRPTKAKIVYCNKKVA